MITTLMIILVSFTILGGIIVASSESHDTQGVGLTLLLISVSLLALVTVFYLGTIT